MKMRLIGSDQTGARAALVAAAFQGFDVEYVEQNEIPSVLCGPFAAPSLVLDIDGNKVIQYADAIFRYIAKAKVGIYGEGSTMEAAQIDGWIDYARNEFNCQKQLKITAVMEKALAALDDVLLYRTYLVGHVLTAADIAMACSLYPIYSSKFTMKDYDLYPNLSRWFMTCLNQPKFKAVADEKVVAKVGKWLTFTGSDGNTSKAPTKGKKAPKKAKSSQKKSTKLGLSVGKDQFADWYTDTIVKAEMIEYFDISGCYILRPWSYSIWDTIKAYIDARIKKLGVENCYFPLFVSEARLNAEKDHVEGFAPEVAWVTHSGETKMNERIAIRPTSETIMYPAFANWVRSHRDLPVKLNQWCNVVRWEFKYPTPFIRTREFLWQEGHTAHAKKEDADAEVMQVLSLYADVYEQLLAVPVIQGKKTEKEKFAGGDFTTTVEGFIPATGRGIQGATSHGLGQNFGKMFGIEFEDESREKNIPYQNSWGMTTRTIGVMVMIHGDDKGLVLPPAVAPIQVIIVPIFMDKGEVAALNAKCEDMAALLASHGIRVQVDKRENYRPGWKFNHWEQKGVPLRLELGPRDLKAQQCRLVRRDTGAKEDVPFSCLRQKIKLEVVQMQYDMLQRATEERDSRLETIMYWEDFVPALMRGNMCLTPWCNEEVEEDNVKDCSKEEALSSTGEEEDERTATSCAAKTLCIPFDQPELPAGTKCFFTGKPAVNWTLWGRSY